MKFRVGRSVGYNKERNKVEVVLEGKHLNMIDRGAVVAQTEAVMLLKHI